MANVIAFKLKFEKAPAGSVPKPNTLERFGNISAAYIRTAPWLVTASVLGRAEYISDGLLDPGLLAPPIKAEHSGNERLRIASIDGPKGPVVRYTYDRHNRLDRVFLGESVSDRFVWSNDSRLEQVVDSDSQATTFTYTPGGPLSSIRYADGAIFKYDYESDGCLASVLYPDGVEVRFLRDHQRRIVRAECRDIAFDYQRDTEGQPKLLTCRADEGLWHLPLDRSKKEQSINVIPRSALANQFVSGLGYWRYDQSSSLCEMFAPTGARRVVHSQDGGRQIVSWSLLGQVKYRFDKAGVLSAIQNRNGTHSVLRRLHPYSQVLIQSIAGASVLNYDEGGRLISERCQNGQGVSYGYGSESVPNVVTCRESILRLTWGESAVLEQMTMADLAKIRVEYAQQRPTRVQLQCSDCSMAQAVDAFTACLWDWQALLRARRLKDISERRST